MSEEIDPKTGLGFRVLGFNPRPCLEGTLFVQEAAERTSWFRSYLKTFGFSVRVQLGFAKL